MWWIGRRLLILRAEANSDGSIQTNGAANVRAVAHPNVRPDPAREDCRSSGARMVAHATLSSPSFLGKERRRPRGAMRLRRRKIGPNWRGGCGTARDPPLVLSVEHYLASRGLVLPPGDALRFEASALHPNKSRLPAMRAAVRDRAGSVIALHTTYLRGDGSGRLRCGGERLELPHRSVGSVGVERDGDRLIEAGPGDVDLADGEDLEPGPDNDDGDDDEPRRPALPGRHAARRLGGGVGPDDGEFRIGVGRQTSGNPR